MTAPTPAGSIAVRAQVMGIRSMATFHRTNTIDLPLADVLDSHADIISTLGNTLAAVTAERDQARQMLADAPHDQSCVANVWTDDEQPFDARPCNCWKSGL